MYFFYLEAFLFNVFEKNLDVFKITYIFIYYSVIILIIFTKNKNRYYDYSQNSILKICVLENLNLKIGPYINQFLFFECKKNLN